MASRGPFDTSGARAGAGPRGSWQGDPATATASPAATRGSSGPGRVGDGVALAAKVYVPISPRFPARGSRFGQRCLHPGQDPGAARR